MQKVSEADFRVFVLSAVAISIGVWDVAFYLGVFKTIFFEKMFMIWAASTAAVLATFAVPKADDLGAVFGWPSRSLLLLPTVWMIVALIDNTGVEDALTDDLKLWISIGIGLLTFPYTIYVVVLVLTPDLVHLRNRRLIVGLVSIVAVIAGLAYLAGRNNHVFLTCRDFKVSGNDLPIRCGP